jgi:hypothetical protein
MKHAADSTVLANFDNTSFNDGRVTTRFSRREGKFIVNTEGPDGKAHDYEVKYTFGLFPLQQYLIDIDNGRIQSLTVAWDSRKKEDGGQRWFSLYPGEKILPGESIHWTGRDQNWNFMCAECHSTNVKKNYDAPQARYATSWTDISVNCEACHGAGSEHLKWAGTPKQRQETGAGPDGWDLWSSSTSGGRYLADRSGTGIGVRSSPRKTDKETGLRALSCASCAAEGRLRPGPLARYDGTGGAARTGAVLGGRADARRSLQLCAVPAEQDVPQGCHLQRLSVTRTRSNCALPAHKSASHATLGSGTKDRSPIITPPGRSRSTA